MPDIEEPLEALEDEDPDLIWDDEVVDLPDDEGADRESPLADETPVEEN